MVTFNPNAVLAGNSGIYAGHDKISSAFTDMAAREVERKKLEAAKLEQEKQAAAAQAKDPAHILAILREGGQVTPVQQAIIDMESAGSQRAMFDPVTGQLVQSGGFPEYQQQNGGQQPDAAPQGVFGALQGAPQQFTPPSPAAQPPSNVYEQAPANLSPKSAQKYQEEQVKQKFAEEKMLREDEFNQRKAEREQKAAIKKERPVLEKGFRDFSQEVTRVSGVIDKLIEQSGRGTVGWGSTVASLAGYEPTKDLEANLELVKASSALDTIQTMKNQSKTGATGFGSLSAPELKLLINAKSALEQSQSEGQFDENLSNYKAILDRTRNNIANDYKATYGEYPKGYSQPESQEVKSSTGDGTLTPEKRARLLELRAKKGAQ